MTPIQAIRQHCIGCMCGQVREVSLCPIHDCPLYPFRNGHNPNIKGRAKGIYPEHLKSRNSARERTKENDLEGE